MGSTETLRLTPHRPPRTPWGAPTAGSSGTRSEVSAQAPSPRRDAGPRRQPRREKGWPRPWYKEAPPALTAVGGGGGRAPFCLLGFVLLVLLPHGGAAAGPAGSAGAGPAAAEEDPGEGPALPRPARPLQTGAAAEGAWYLRLARTRNPRRSGASPPRPCLPEVIPCLQRCGGSSRLSVRPTAPRACRRRLLREGSADPDPGPDPVAALCGGGVHLAGAPGKDRPCRGRLAVAGSRFSLVSLFP